MQTKECNDPCFNLLVKNLELFCDAVERQQQCQGGDEEESKLKLLL